MYMCVCITINDTRSVDLAIRIHSDKTFFLLMNALLHKTLGPRNPKTH